MIKVVTDSVASIPVGKLRGRAIESVTLFVRHDGREFEDSNMDIDAFYADIHNMVDNVPTSSQPSQQSLIQTFETIARSGDELLGIFASSELSGTYEGVVRALRTIKEKYPSFKGVAIDSHSVGFDEGYPVLTGLEAVEANNNLASCVEKTIDSVEATRFLFTPETLIFLQKGGRIGNAAAMLGNLIKLAPVLTVINGKATAIAKTRSRKKALEYIANEFAKDTATYGLKRVVVHYIGDKAPAVEWAHAVVEPLLGESVDILPVSPVIGTHVGPAVGIVYECEKPMPHKFPQGRPSMVFE